MNLACEECGSPVAEGDAFCGECGAKIIPAGVEEAPVEEETVESIPEPVPAPVTGQVPPEPPPVPVQPSRVACSSCGRGMNVGEHFCPWCGVATGAPPVVQPPAGAERQWAAQPTSPSGQARSDVSERVKRTWDNSLTRAPLVFLGGLVLGFLLLGDAIDFSVLYPLILAGVVLILLVVHATSPAAGEVPILTVAGIAFVLSVLGTLIGVSTLLAVLASDGVTFEISETQDESITVTMGAVAILVGSIGLFLSSLRAYIRGQ